MTPPPSLQGAREILAALAVKARAEADAIDVVLHSLADTEAKLAMDLDRRVPAPTQSHALDYHPHPLDRRYSGPPVSSWATGDGTRHRFDDRSHNEYDTSGWTAFCGVSLENAVPRPDPVDCDRCEPYDPAFCRHGLDFDGGLASDGCKTSWRPGDLAPDLTRGESWRCRRSDARVVPCALAAGHTGDCWAP